MEHPPRTTHSSHFEVDIECDEENENIPVDGLYGPGRTIGKFLDVAGRRIDSLIPKRAPPTEDHSPHDTPSQSIASERGHESFTPVPLDVTFVCDSNDSDEMIRVHYSAGRTIGRALDVAGHSIDVSMSRMSERVGYGPRAVAEKVRVRFVMIGHYFHHYDGRWTPCRCQWATRDRLLQAAAIDVATRTLLKDVRRLVKYTRSNVLLTKKQAIVYILDLCLAFPELRLVFKQMDAVGMITAQLSLHSSIRHGDGFLDNLLLSSSRKALVSSKDVEVATLLKMWCNLPPPITWGTESNAVVFISLWRKFIPLLRNQDVAFLVLRGLRRSVRTWGWDGGIIERIMGSLASAMAILDDNFEWNEFEAISTLIFKSLTDVKHDSRSIAMDIILQFARNLPRALMTQPFKRLLANYRDIDLAESTELLVMKAALLRIFDEGRNHALHLEVPECLDAFRAIFDCPIERAVANHESEILLPGNKWDSRAKSANTLLYYEIVHHLDSDNSNLRAKAWKYAYYFLARGLVECDLILEAISTTTFASTADFTSFRRKQRTQHVPAYEPFTPQWLDWVTIYRHLDERTKKIVFSTSCSPSSLKAEQLSFARKWVTTLRTKAGSAIQIEGRCPLVAGYDASGACSYVGWLNIPDYNCSTCRYRIRGAYSTVTNGTKPEDLRLEVSCPHEKRIFVPESIDISYLRYSPDEYPEDFRGGRRGVDATGPFSWLPAERCDKIIGPYTYRVVTATEALEIGIVQNLNRDSDNESATGRSRRDRESNTFNFEGFGGERTSSLHGVGSDAGSVPGPATPKGEETSDIVGEWELLQRIPYRLPNISDIVIRLPQGCENVKVTFGSSC